jgi:toxin CcdB
LGRSTVPAAQLNPHLEIRSERHILQTQWLAAIPKARLGRRIANLGDSWDDITRALDMLLIGF